MDCRLCSLEEIGGERGVVARQRLYAGDRCIMESPLVWALAPEHRSARCAYCCCLREGETSIECAQCGSLFCDEKCEHLARHSDECAVLTALGEETSETVVAVARLCILSVVIDFKTHQNLVSKETLTQYDAMANGLTELLLNLGYKHITPEQVLYWTVALSTNALALLDHEPLDSGSFFDKNHLLNGVVLGLGLSPALAMLNHACSPTGAISLNLQQGCAPTLYAGAIKNIEQGQALTISYLPFAGFATKKRSTILLEKYYFQCKCSLCTTGDRDWLRDKLDYDDPQLCQARLSVEACYQSLFDSVSIDNLLTKTEYSLASLPDDHFLKIQFIIVAITSHAIQNNRQDCFRLTQHLVNILSKNKDIHALIIDPINYARILCLATAAAPTEAPTAWIDCAIDIFHAHLGGFSSLLAQNARALLLESNSTPSSSPFMESRSI